MKISFAILPGLLASLAMLSTESYSAVKLDAPVATTLEPKPPSAGPEAQPKFVAEEPPPRQSSPVPVLKFNLKEGGTFSSLDRPGNTAGQEVIPRGGLNFDEVDVSSVLKVYQQLSGRTVIRSSRLPKMAISFENETPLTRREALQALDTVLAQNEITMVVQGTKFVKAVFAGQAVTEAPPLVDLPPEELPESSSYMAYFIEVKHLRASEVAKALQPLTKMPNSIVAIDVGRMILVRDYASNIRAMVRMVQRLDLPGNVGPGGMRLEPSMEFGPPTSSQRRTVPR